MDTVTIRDKDTGAEVTVCGEAVTMAATVDATLYYVQGLWRDGTYLAGLARQVGRPSGRDLTPTDLLRARDNLRGFRITYRLLGSRLGYSEATVRRVVTETWRTKAASPSACSFWPADSRAPVRRRAHGLSQLTRDRMRQAQGGCCAICGRLDGHGDAALEVDHDHRHCQGREGCRLCVRGLLCGPCNRSLGRIGDHNSDRLIAYLSLRR